MLRGWQWAGLVVLAGCTFTVRPISVGDGTDLGSGADLSVQPVDDLSVPSDLATLDLASDLATSLDLRLPPDMVAVTPPVLSGVRDGIPANVDLTTDGTLDWVHFGRSLPSDVNRKAAVPTAITHATAGSINRATPYVPSFSWSDGTPTAIEPSTSAGIYTTGLNNGFTITLPAGTTTRSVRLYVAVYRGTITVNAHLSDGSIADYTDALVDNTAATYARYTLNFRASVPTQSLVITLRLTGDAVGGSVNLMAASHF